jgi:prepilin peptidase CpaA
MSASHTASMATLPAALLVALGLICAYTDVRRGRIYNAITYPAIALGLIVQVALFGWAGALSAVEGFAVGFFPAFIVFATGGMGGGDVKLLGAIGALAGPTAALETLLISLMFGAFFGLAQLAWHGKLLHSLWRCVRWLGGLFVPSVRPTPAQKNDPHLQVRFGLAIACGIAATIWDLRLGGLSMFFG